MSPIDRRLFTHINWPLLAMVAMLFGTGVLNLYSASGFRIGDGVSLNPFYQKQCIWGLAGLCCLVALTVFDYRYLKHAAWPLMIVTLVLLALVPVIGKTVYGAKRWLDFGAFSLQPSELAKFATLLVGALMLSKDSGRLGWLSLLTVLAVVLPPAAMVIVQPDLGSGLNILLLLCGMILYRGLAGRVFKVLLVTVPALIPCGWFFLKPYQKLRILTLFNPERDPLGSGYHIIQSQIAIGSGQMWGKGFLEGTQSQLRFLPEKHTDFAVAVFAEEWGFVGSIILVAMFCVFLTLLAGVARDAKDRFGSFLAAGVFFYFFWQILINMGMVLGIMPVVGIPLPFISYGGSATIVNFCLIGIALNVSMRRFVFKKT
ncbi:Peptidoglycan glycosyltransferase MrdB [Fundidesulfovibrio magnetotacticus]|uniref:Peptidoglycan glycosyltransferase RodA n=1 Tax=Fundidesulfovibrio magnetotacticus TaxID=2730080 RepID=A0A6V8M041_9BACT|nr:rod shape-determining protein RodA [Fundidesulfovibrio magnetotacticus]GFK95227.1 Peptidoglycan glycosyltransferase MrdB [Fundidesulfovibrio magnetotacticus]